MRKLILALAAALALIVTTALPASARWASPDAQSQTNSTLQYDTTPKVARDGESIRWDVRITCPAGEAFTLDPILIQRDPASVPELLGEDDGIRATLNAPVTGTCTGRSQTFKLKLITRALTFPVTGFFPITPTSSIHTSAQIVLSGADFFALYCAAPNCAGETGPRVTFV